MILLMMFAVCVNIIVWLDVLVYIYAGQPMLGERNYKIVGVLWQIGMSMMQMALIINLRIWMSYLLKINFMVKCTYED